MYQQYWNRQRLRQQQTATARLLVNKMASIGGAPSSMSYQGIGGGGSVAHAAAHNFRQQQQRQQAQKPTQKQQQQPIWKGSSSGGGMIAAAAYYNPDKPDTWGPIMWTTMHVVAAAYPLRPTEADMQKYKAYYENLSGVLPCKMCQEHFKEIMEKFPLTETHLASRENLSRWVISIRNQVNGAIGKTKVYTYSEIARVVNQNGAKWGDGDEEEEAPPATAAADQSGGGGGDPVSELSAAVRESAAAAAAAASSRAATPSQQQVQQRLAYNRRLLYIYNANKNGGIKKESAMALMNQHADAIRQHRDQITRHNQQQQTQQMMMTKNINSVEPISKAAAAKAALLKKKGGCGCGAGRKKPVPPVIAAAAAAH